MGELAGAGLHALSRDDLALVANLRISREFHRVTRTSAAPMPSRSAPFNVHPRGEIGNRVRDRVLGGGLAGEQESERVYERQESEKSEELDCMPFPRHLFLEHLSTARSKLSPSSGCTGL